MSGSLWVWPPPSQLGTSVQAPYKGRPIVCITGDAGFGYTAMEMETMAKYRLPAIVIVYNNNIWGTRSGNHQDKVIAGMHVFQENLRYDRGRQTYRSIARRRGEPK